MFRRRLVALIAAGSLGFSMVAGILPGSLGATRAMASHPPGGHVYTFDADFAQGSSINLISSTPDQLQLDDQSKPFPFIWVAASNRGTVIKIDTRTGVILGEYWTAPQNMTKNPSRTTVDKKGNVWVGNRDEAGNNKGSAVHVGLQENGECVDRNGNGVIDTSTGLGDIRNWSNAGNADLNGGVSTADDECIIHFVRTDGVRNRHVSVDANNNVWIAGGAFGDSIRRYHLFDENGNSLRVIDMANPAQTGEPSQIVSCCYGGLVSPDGILWGSTLSNNLIRIDPSKPDGDPDLVRITDLGRTSYGMGIDSQGNIWVSDLSSSISKVDANGVLLGAFPLTGFGGRGVAVTPDDHVWVANSNSASVTRITNSGAVVATIPVGNTPTGVAVDAAGKVWITNLASHTVSRIDPATNTVDLIVGLGVNAGPYNYSDMTGSILIGPPNLGTWTLIHDTGMPGALWGSVSWNGSTPGDSSLTVSVASSNDGVVFGPEVATTSGATLGVSNGRYLRVAVRFERSTTGQSPVLVDLTVSPNSPPTVDLAPAGPIAEGTSVGLVAMASDPDGDPLTYTWTLVGPGTLVGSGDTAVYSYDDGPAVATVTVTVSDGQFIASSSREIITFNVAPTVDAGADQSEYWGLAVSFAGVVADPSGADTLAGLNPTWDFGDGNVAPGQLASHAYANPGLYSATLTASDKDGGTTSDSTDVTVTKRPSSLTYTGDSSQFFGTGGTLSARLGDGVDAGTADLGGRTVTFTLDGVTYTTTTDANGDASTPAPAFLLPGTYAVDVDFAEHSHYLGSSAQAILTVNNSVGKVTAGSIRMENKGRGGFNVQSEGTAVKGELQYQNGGTNFHAHKLTALSVSLDKTKAWFAGVGKDGRTFIAYVEDNGEPGQNDIFKIWIDGTPENGNGSLTGGNIQIH